MKVCSTKNGSRKVCLVHDKKEGDKNNEGAEPPQFIEVCLIALLGIFGKGLSHPPSWLIHVY